MKLRVKYIAATLVYCVLMFLSALGNTRSYAQDNPRNAVPIAGDQASPVSTLTKDQAIEIALKFCRALGTPATGQPTVLFPAPPRYTFQQDSYWLPRWRITFPDSSEFEVVDSTSVVSRYTNLSERKKPEPAKLNAEAPIPENRAIQLANIVLAASGARDTTSLRGANYSNSNANPKFSYLAEWYVVYNRLEKGIPYHRDQQVIVILQAQTGSVLGFNLVYPTPPPTNGPSRFSSDQAIEVAKAQISRSDLDPAIFKSCSQIVVQPNSWWLDPAPPKLQPGVSRIVWDCQYTSGRKRCDVWVDTETGKIIGGEMIQSK